ncbi:hypothetical protein GCM10025870_07760 [Agromyces marinus]|uniref:Uncharacterized protein n=1 Tax=Agromyces marinus TaxID=1389020 RepID=A0ABM8GYX8_9MICO|nr:hypothetical protein GCM10025870_07760 [Agromyces marinus]
MQEHGRAPAPGIDRGVEAANRLDLDATGLEDPDERLRAVGRGVVRRERRPRRAHRALQHDEQHRTRDQDGGDRDPGAPVPEGCAQAGRDRLGRPRTSAHSGTPAATGSALGVAATARSRRTIAEYATSSPGRSR